MKSEQRETFHGLRLLRRWGQRRYNNCSVSVPADDVSDLCPGGSRRPGAIFRLENRDGDIAIHLIA